MQVTVFGASGKVGHLVVEELLARGHTVVAFIHRRQLFVPNNRLIIKTGDIYDAAAVAEALRGSDAVISCLGSWGPKGRDVLSAAMRNIIPAMREQKISRIVTLTGSGATAPQEKTGVGHGLIMKVFRPFPAGKVFNDGEEHMRLLAASGLDWTTVRSPVMTNFGGASYRLDVGPGSQLRPIARAAVANALVDQLDDTRWLHRAPVIYQ
ncbi:MAG TPA: NAD(P)H-binding protein [Candidatus Saccharimonadales bacterium]|nr:NAD(P)H-binding protein [Candidatus Saccharimonadales bacterium]